ncbi:MAG: hypothetical protein JNK57_11180 [Planctomycetaceae bacterium]|nr:hypothetical protein [Planctomycetaceae bacterium]
MLIKAHSPVFGEWAFLFLPTKTLLDAIKSDSIDIFAHLSVIDSATVGWLDFPTTSVQMIGRVEAKMAKAFGLSDYSLN